jgi:hypothetical protein
MCWTNARKILQIHKIFLRGGKKADAAWAQDRKPTVEGRKSEVFCVVLQREKQEVDVAKRMETHKIAHAAS